MCSILWNTCWNIGTELHYIFFCGSVIFYHNIRHSNTIPSSCFVSSSPSFFSTSHCFDWQGVGAVWARDNGASVLRVPSCSLPGMATFVSASKPNFKVTSTRDPTPLISYHADTWMPTYSPNSIANPATGHTHEMRASVIMKTSDVTSSWPLTPILLLLFLHILPPFYSREYHHHFQGIGMTEKCHFSPRWGSHGALKRASLWFYCSFSPGLEPPLPPSVVFLIRVIAERCRKWVGGSGPMAHLTLTCSTVCICEARRVRVMQICDLPVTVRGRRPSKSAAKSYDPATSWNMWATHARMRPRGWV